MVVVSPGKAFAVSDAGSAAAAAAAASAKADITAPATKVPLRPSPSTCRDPNPGLLGEVG